MKKIAILALFALLICSVFAFTSCDQETVDSARADLMATAKDLFEPLLKEAETSETSRRPSTESTDFPYPTWPSTVPTLPSSDPTDASSDMTDASSDMTDASSDMTDASSDMTDASSDMTDASSDMTDASSDMTDASSDMTDASSDMTDASSVDSQDFTYGSDVESDTTESSRDYIYIEPVYSTPLV